MSAPASQKKTMTELSQTCTSHRNVPRSRCLLDLPNETLLAVIARLDFHTEDFLHLSLVSKQFHSLMSIYKRHILNEIAAVQFPEAAILRQDTGDHDVASIIDLRGPTIGINELVQAIMQTDCIGPALSQDPRTAKILTTSFHIFATLNSLQIDPRWEGDSTVFLLCLGRHAIASMYYTSLLLCVYLLRKAARFQHRRWANLLSQPTAIASLQMLLVSPGVHVFWKLATRDEVWSQSEYTQLCSESQCIFSEAYDMAQVVGLNFGDLIARISYMCGPCSRTVGASPSGERNRTDDQAVVEGSGIESDWELRRAENRLESERGTPNFPLSLMRNQSPDFKAATDSAVERNPIKYVSWGSVIQSELLWQSLNFVDFGTDPYCFIINIIKALSKYQTMDPVEVRSRHESLRLQHPGSTWDTSMSIAVSIDWARYVSNMICSGEFEMWEASSTVFDNLQDAADEIAKALGLLDQTQDIWEELTDNGEIQDPGPYRVFLRVHEMYTRLTTEKQKGAG